jgi:hypothetical protein
MQNFASARRHRKQSKAGGSVKRSLAMVCPFGIAKVFGLDVATHRRPVEKDPKNPPQTRHIRPARQTLIRTDAKMLS